MTEESGPSPDQPAPAPGPGQPPAYPPAYPAAHPQAGPNPYAQAPVPGFPVYVLPDHPKATTAMVLGIVSLAGLFTCVLPVVVAPIAWILGAQARREIRSAPQQWGGESKATAGMVLGIVGTVLLALGILAIALVIVIAVASSGSLDSTSV